MPGNALKRFVHSGCCGQPPDCRLLIHASRLTDVRRSSQEQGTHRRTCMRLLPGVSHQMYREARSDICHSAGLLLHTSCFRFCSLSARSHKRRHTLGSWYGLCSVTSMLHRLPHCVGRLQITVYNSATPVMYRRRVAVYRLRLRPTQYNDATYTILQAR